MTHINLTSWKGSLTDWTKFNYIYGGLPAYYADIANIKGNYLRKSNNLWDMANAVKVSTKQLASTTLTDDGFTASVNNDADPYAYLSIDAKVEQGKTYSIYIKSDEAMQFYALKYGRNVGNASFYNSYNEAESSYTWTAASTDYITIGLEYKQNVASHTVTTTITLVEGSTAPIAFEPYGKMVIEKNYNRYVFTGNETIRDFAALDGKCRFGITEVFGKGSSNPNVKPNIISEELDTITPAAWYNMTSTGVTFGISGYGVVNRLQIAIIGVTTEANALTYLTGKAITYELATPQIVVVPEFVALYRYYGNHNVIEDGMILPYPYQSFAANVYKVEAGKSYKISNGTSSVRAFYTENPIPAITQAYDGQRIVEGMNTETIWTAPISGYVSVRSANFKIECLYVA